ncbi:hypothetical protein DFQ26_000443 [Actinomortierella ambigua]|nr:hypothetical protein DFQ26_000443 [Actinomortierella ambigua]
MTRADKIELILELDANVGRDILLHRSAVVQGRNAFFSWPGSEFPSPGAFWDACKGQFLEEAQEAQKAQHTPKRRKRSTAERRLKQALSTLAKTPDNDHATEEYAHALVEVAELDSYTVERALPLAHVQWIEEGERPSPHLTAWLRGAKANQTIPAQQWNNNSPPTTDPEEMANIATSFYHTLYTAEPTDATTQDELLATIPANPTVPASVRSRLDRDVLTTDVELAIDAMAQRSAPDPDDLPYAFYKAFRQPSENLVMCSAFADDTTLGIGPDDTEVALRAIDFHEMASGARANKSKSERIPLSTTTAQAIKDKHFVTRPTLAEFTHLDV